MNGDLVLLSSDSYYTRYGLFIFGLLLKIVVWQVKHQIKMLSRLALSLYPQEEKVNCTYTYTQFQFSKGKILSFI